MPRSRVARLMVVGTLVGFAACGDREPPPPAEAPPAPQAVESPPAPEDSLPGDSVMARDTARVPE
jgi:hypothetical protein